MFNIKKLFFRKAPEARLEPHIAIMGEFAEVAGATLGRLSVKVKELEARIEKLEARLDPFGGPF